MGDYVAGLIDLSITFLVLVLLVANYMRLKAVLLRVKDLQQNMAEHRKIERRFDAGMELEV